MTTVGIIAKEAKKEVIEVVDSLREWTEKNGHSLVVEKETSKLLKLSEKTARIDRLASQTDVIITLGGDGTLIRVAKFAAKTKTIVIGVNFGKLGFLTEIAPSQVIDSLSDVIDGVASLAKREMIQAKVVRKDKEIFSSVSLNDVVILKSSKGSLVDLDISKDDEPMMRLRADGLIFATPTGSTAYSLAAGGSIVYPSLSVLLVTPVCPHSLTNRPLILPMDDEYSVTIPDHDEQLVLSMDGQEHLTLRPMDKIYITRAETSVRFVKSSTNSYFDILRTKLNWSLGYEKK